MLKLTQLPQTGGLELWRGPSKIDGAPIVFIATLQTTNRKTGNMIQTWILHQDMSPVDAVMSGADESICGNCIHRAINGKKRSCYVNVGQAPLQIWRAWQNNKYPQVKPFDFGDYYSGYRSIRLGAYGDPAALPLHMLSSLMCHKWVGHTGYTHQWRNCDPRFADYLMASVDTEEEYWDAVAAGWRCFRTLAPGDSLTVGEISCPASDEAGKLTTCERCKLCAGNFRNHKNKPKDIAIIAHGVGAKNYARKLEVLHD